MVCWRECLGPAKADPFYYYIRVFTMRKPDRTYVIDEDEHL